MIIKEDTHRQPRVFRNRSLDYANRNTRLLLGKFSAKALRGLHRGRATPEKGKVAGRDRPLEHVIEEKEKSQSEGGRVRNDDSFSSLPSTHASRDPFLNDDVPIEISRLEVREDRPRATSVKKEDEANWTKNIVGESLVKANLDVGSPPASLSSTSTLRKRSSLWKRTYDPDSEFQSRHERLILKAVSLSEAAVKEKSVVAAQQLGSIVAAQAGELDEVLGEVEKKVVHARVVAEHLPSTRDVRFETLLYGGEGAGGDGRDNMAKAEAEKMFLELQWTEKVWDVEAMVAEKRFKNCVHTIEKLNRDGINESASPRTLGRYQNIVQQLVVELSRCCTQGGGETAGIFAPLLARVGMAEHARRVVLRSAEAELIAELQAVTAPENEVMPRTVSLLLDKTLEMFKRTHVVYSQISQGGSQNSSYFVAWVVEQSDKIYAGFVSPILTKMRKADPVMILETIEAARHRKVHEEARLQRDGESLVALLETRITTHIRKELDGPISDVERQLVERARVYASAIPRNWKEGPYQSGKAVCDELNILSRGFEGALMNLDEETDVLIGNLFARLALEYCTNVLETGVRAAAEDNKLTTNAVQEGVRETFLEIAKTVTRVHQRYGKIPLLDRVVGVLTSANLGEVRMLLSEVASRRTLSPSVAVSAPNLSALGDISCYSEW